jgi:hypothetical protein
MASDKEIRRNVELAVWVVIAAGILMFSWAMLHKCGARQKTVVKTEHWTDTVVVTKRDTVRQDSVVRLPGRIDTLVTFGGTDTLYIEGTAMDTVFIKELEFRIVTHDTVIHDTVKITETVDKKIRHYGFGVTAGAAAVYGLRTRKFDAGPGIMVGFTYKF